MSAAMRQQSRAPGGGRRRPAAPVPRPRCCWPAPGTTSCSWTGRPSRATRCRRTASPAAGSSSSSRWGLLDEVHATGAPAVREVAVPLGETPRRPADQGPRRRRPPGRTAAARARRACSDAAAGPARRCAPASRRPAYCRRDGRVVGVDAPDPDGDARGPQRRVVVGADGVRSRMAGWLGAETLEPFTAETATFYTYVADVPWRGLRVPRRAGRLRRHLPDQRRPGLRLARPTDPRLGFGARTAGADRAAALVAQLARRVARPRPAGARRAGHGAGARLGRAAQLRPSSPSARAGRWSATPATTATRSPGTASPTRSATRSCSPTPSTAACATPRRETRRMAAYQRRRDRPARETFDLTRALTAFPPRAASSSCRSSSPTPSSARPSSSRPSRTRRTGGHGRLTTNDPSRRNNHVHHRDHPAAATASTSRHSSPPSTPSSHSPRSPGSSSARRTGGSAAPTTGAPSPGSTAPARSTRTRHADRHRRRPPGGAGRRGQRARRPAELLLNALGACLMSGLANIAAARGIDLEGVTATVEGDIDLRGILGLDPRSATATRASASSSTSRATPRPRSWRSWSSSPSALGGVRRRHQRRPGVDRRRHRLTVTGRSPRPGAGRRPRATTRSGRHRSRRLASRRRSRRAAPRDS